MKPSMKDLYSRVGQCMIMGFEDVTMTGGLKDLLQTIQPGGVILFARNLADAHQTHLLVGQCQDLAQTPLFTCVDMEGGTVDRLRGVLTQSPSAAEVYSSGDERLFRRHGRTIGAACRALGFNTDFAPVLDLAQPRSRNVLASRAVSANGTNVARYGKEFLQGLAEEKVLGCGEHFPGLGDADLDSHHALPRVDKAWKPFWKEDLEPYRVLRSELPFIMVAHAVYPAIVHDDLPASLSPKWIGEMLRGVLDYQGLVISDDLEMGAILGRTGAGEAAVATLKAGADMFLVCQTEKNVHAAFEAVIHAAEKDPAFAETVTKAAARITRFKKCARELRGFPMSPTQTDVDALKRQIDALSQDVAAAAREMAHA